MLRNRSKHGNRQEEECSDNEDRTKHEETESGGIVVKCPQTGRACFLRPEKSCHGDRCDDRQIAAEKHYQTRRDIPRNGHGRGCRIVGETEGYPKAVKGGTVIGG